MIGLGIGIPYTRGGVSAPTLGTTIATTHYNRVIADGGVLPAGISGLGSVLDSVISAYGVTSSADFNTKVPVFLDPQYTGYKLGAGAGTTAGQAARTVYAINSSADVTQTTAASQPLLLAWSGDNYWWGSGVSGNYSSTPNAVANQITGDVEIISYIDYKNNGTFQTITSKIIQSTGFCYGLFINSSNQIYVSFGSGASETPVNSIASLGAAYTGWIKVSRVSLTGLVSFATSTNASNTNISSIYFTSFGTPAIGYIGALGNPNNTVQIGAFGTNQIFPFTGKIYRATISNSIGGAPVVDFNPSEYSASSSQTAWNSSTGEVWTINTGTAASGYKGVLVDRSILQGDGIDDRMTSSAFTSLTSWTNYFAYNGYTGNGSGRIIDDITSFQKNEILLSATTISIFNGSLSIPSRIINTTSFLVSQKTSSNSSLGYQNTNSPTTNLADGRSYTFTGIALFSAQFAAGFGNNSLNTLIITGQADNSTIRSSMYNTIKSFNNNAF